jgi:hypothetical protein
MPLIHSPSDKAREKNIKTEIEHGKPIKQAVAIGYDEQREAKKHPHHKEEKMSEHPKHPHHHEEHQHHHHHNQKMMEHPMMKNHEGKHAIGHTVGKYMGHHEFPRPIHNLGKVEPHHGKKHKK